MYIYAYICIYRYTYVCICKMNQSKLRVHKITHLYIFAPMSLIHPPQDHQLVDMRYKVRVPLTGQIRQQSGHPSGSLICRNDLLGLS